MKIRLLDKKVIEDNIRYVVLCDSDVRQWLSSIDEDYIQINEVIFAISEKTYMFAKLKWA